MIILGAGLAGSLAAALNQTAKVYEGSDGSESHKAILRFRSPDIGEAVGIPFRKVKVYKGIWHNDEPVQLSPRYINLYSRKVSDAITLRSIHNIDPVDRWIAPLDFHDQLKAMCKNRIVYNCHVQDISHLREHISEPMISTLPIYVNANLLNMLNPMPCGKGVTFNRPIFVSRYEIEDCDVHMTYYYTAPNVTPYRASISGNLLIIESMFEINDDDIKTVFRSFGLTGVNNQVLIENFEQKNGKISPIQEAARKSFIIKATIKDNFYSLGRFATWRNLVLDDVYKDILHIRRSLNYNIYDHFREQNK